MLLVLLLFREVLPEELFEDMVCCTAAVNGCSLALREKFKMYPYTA
jgi:hypothetical protein